MRAGGLPDASCYAPCVNRVRTVRRVARRLSPIAAIAVALVVVGCSANTNPSTGPQGSDATPTASVAPTVGPPSPDVATPTPDPGPTATATDAGASPSPSNVANGCSGSDANRTFFDQAAATMSWPVYCAVLPTGWFVDAGSYRVANGGHLNVTYRGPGNAHLAIAEGNVCDGLGTDIDVCAPRDAVIGPAAFGDQVGELGQEGTGLVLDVDRGANPSWRVTGLGISAADFTLLCAAMFHVTAGG